MAVVVPYVIMTVVGIATTWIMMSMQKPIEGPKLGDIATQTSKEGGPRLIVYGIVRPIAGNVIACSDPKIVESSSGGGKGGGSSQTTQSVYRTYAIGVCEGPVTSIRRVWRNNKLVYDSRIEGGVLNTWGAKNNPVFLQKAKFYLGNFTQLPDPSLEAIWGVGSVPAHRGTCYMVMNNEDLTELGGALPQYIYEVERAEGIFLTSKPYVLEVIEEVGSLGNSIESVQFRAQLLELDNGTESIQTASASVESMVFRSSLTDFDSGIESVQSVGGSIESMEFSQDFFLIEYENSLPEEIQLIEGSVESIIFRAGLIKYDDALPESVESLGGSVESIEFYAT